MKRVNLWIEWLLAVVVVGCNSSQIHFSTIDQMPGIPTPYFLLDWQYLGLKYDTMVFDPLATGQFLPLMWWDDSRVNFNQTGFGLFTYVGGNGQQNHGSSAEAIAIMPAVLSGALVGIDQANKSGKGFENVDFAHMLQNYFNVATKQNVFLNNQATQAGGSFWYDVLPNIYIAAILSFFPDDSLFSNMYSAADQWYNAAYAMRISGKGIPDFNHTGFSFNTQQPIDNGKWREPDSAAGIAYFEYMAYKKWGEPQHLEAANWGLSYLDSIDVNPLYEILLVFGPLTAARMNAEQGANYNVTKLLDWVFGESDTRSGWGMISGAWNNTDVYGLIGSLTDGGGYAFAMNTFVTGGAISPVARYNTRYAYSIGKYMQNSVNAARLFYGSQWDEEHQTNRDWQNSYDPLRTISYEGLRFQEDGFSPRATGDPMTHGWGATNLALYGGGCVGWFGGIISSTNSKYIQQIDLLKTDYYHDEAYPTYLFYNPLSTTTYVTISVGYTVDLYDAVQHKFLANTVTGSPSFPIQADNVVVLVLVPSGGTVTTSGNQIKVNGVVIDYDTSA